MIEFSTIAAAAFAPHMDSLESLRSRVSQAIKWPVQLVFGDTDGVQPYASLCIDDVPAGSNGDPGVLVSVLRGEGVPGYAVVVPADCMGTLCQVNDVAHMPTGLDIARAAAVQEFRHQSRGAKAWARACAGRPVRPRAAALAG